MNRASTFTFVILLLATGVVSSWAEDPSETKKRPTETGRTAQSDARQVAEAFVAAVLSDDFDDAAALAGVGVPVEAAITEFREGLGVESLEIVTVLSADREGHAMAVSEPVTLTISNPDGRDTGCLLFMLIKTDRVWQVEDIDFESDVAKFIEEFNREYPDAKEIPVAKPTASTDMPAVYWLKHKKASSLALHLDALLPKSVVVVAEDRTNSLLVHSDSESADHIGNVVQTLDELRSRGSLRKPMSVGRIHFFPLEHASASTLVPILSSLFQTRVMLEPRPVFVADQVKHWLLVRCEPDRFVAIREMVSKLDQPTQQPSAASALTNRPVLVDGNLSLLSERVDVVKDPLNYAYSLVKQIRLLDADAGEARADALKKRLRINVVKAFEARQQTQREELARMQQRLLRIQQLIEQREAIKNEIIDHRVAELLAPSLRWPDDKDARENKNSEASPPELDGFVIDVSDKKLVQISLGHDDGVRKGVNFHVYRKRTYLGRIEIIVVQADTSLGRIKEAEWRAPMRRGDRVATRLAGREAKGKSEALGSPTALGQSQLPRSNLSIGGSSGRLDARPGPQVDAEVLIQYPHTATLTLKNDSEGQSSITIPGRLSVVTGQTLRLTLSNIPEFEGVDLSASIELASVTKQTQAFLELSAIPLEFTTEDINQAISGNLVTKVVYLPNAENAEFAIAGIETLVTTRLDPGIDPLEDAQKRGQILAILKLGNRRSQASTGTFRRDDFLSDREMQSIIGRDPGEPIYNDKLKRFKFRLEKIEVSTVETAEAFFHHYRKGKEDNPKIIGAWGDPLTNSLIVVAPPEAEQAIRNSLAEWEAELIGIFPAPDESLEIQQTYLLRERTELLRNIARAKLDVIDAEAADEEPSEAQIKALNHRMNSLSAELKTVERKLEVIKEAMEDDPR